MSIKHDPIEQTPAFLAIIEQAEQIVREELLSEGYPDKPAFMGWCHMYWSVKRRVLREKFGIDWNSPAAMNPDVRFD